LQPAVAAALDRLFACLVAGGAGAPLNVLKHHVASKHGIWCLRGFFRGDSLPKHHPTRRRNALAHQQAQQRSYGWS
ncbi:hypothetical protein, partial [Xanthomonas oryzae]|uniref:hypothetical protein n=1 Tax=Xanthomonas oryzae TaxID=347 RepID=UPI001C4D4DBB